MESHETPLVGSGDLGKHMFFIIHPWGSQSGEPGQLFTCTAQTAKCSMLCGVPRQNEGDVGCRESGGKGPASSPTPTPNSNSTSLALLD